MTTPGATALPVETVSAAVTALFVPGDRPDRYGKAYASGADLVIVDLEDAVATGDKAEARAAAVAALRPGAGSGVRALVRCNDVDSDWGREDLLALRGLLGERGHGLLGIMVPKVGRVEALAEVVGVLAGNDRLAVIGLVESAVGVVHARALAAVPGVTRLAFGALDFAADVAASPDAMTGQLARAEVVIASRAAGLPAPLESPSTELDAPDRVEATTRTAAELGFGGRLCIHPGQLDAVRAGFAPTAAEVAWAERVAGAGEAAARVDGQMVDRPVLGRAWRILRRSAEAGPAEGRR